MRVRRQVLGMSQQSLARLMGVSYQQVQKYERGTNRLGSSRLHRLAEVLDVPVAWFFDETSLESRRHELDDERAPAFLFDGSGGPEPPASEPEPDRDALELLRAYSRISEPEVRRRLVELARALARSKRQA